MFYTANVLFFTQIIFQVDLIYQLQKAECLCSKPQLSSTLNISKTTSRHEADLDRHACNMLEVNQTSADIQVLYEIFVFTLYQCMHTCTCAHTACQRTHNQPFQ